MSTSRDSGLPPLGVTSAKTKPGNALSVTHGESKAFGNETVQISFAPHFLEIIQSAQRDLTHPERTTGLLQCLVLTLTFSLLFPCGFSLRNLKTSSSWG